MDLAIFTILVWSLVGRVANIVSFLFLLSSRWLTKQISPDFGGSLVLLIGWSFLLTWVFLSVFVLLRATVLISDLSAMVYGEGLSSVPSLLFYGSVTYFVLLGHAPSPHRE